MVERLLRTLVRQGFRRGTRGGHPAWLVVAAGAWMATRARRRGDDVAYRTVLRPGESLVVTTASPRRRRNEPTGD